jgi:diguanylate cyclase (GGDEF)-like protein
VDESIESRGPASNSTDNAKRPMSSRSPLHEGYLIMIYGEHLGEPMRLGWGSTEIGRSSRCEIALDQESISRRHARISWDGRTYRLKDLGSQNGTYVNDRLVTEGDLHDGDLIKVGRTVFKFLTAGNVETEYHREMYQMIGQDCLTGIYNAGRFHEILQRYVSRSRRLSAPLSLILFDLDHFASVNEHHGNLAADSILKELVTGIRKEFPVAQYIFARYSGDKFALIAPETGLVDAADLAERIRLFVQLGEFADKRWHVTLSGSFAVAELGEADDHTALFRACEDRLLQAKRQGGNRLISA